MKYLDTNVLVHAAISQEPREHRLSRQFLARVQMSGEEVFISDLVLAEVAAILRTARAGRLTHEQIRDFLSPIVSWPTVHMADKSIWFRVLEVFVQNQVDLADAHQVAMLERDGTGAIISFDADFDRIPGVKRDEP